MDFVCTNLGYCIDHVSFCPYAVMLAEQFVCCTVVKSVRLWEADLLVVWDGGRQIRGSGYESWRIEVGPPGHRVPFFWRVCTLASARRSHVGLSWYYFQK